MLRRKVVKPNALFTAYLTSCCTATCPRSRLDTMQKTTAWGRSQGAALCSTTDDKLQKSEGGNSCHERCCNSLAQSQNPCQPLSAAQVLDLLVLLGETGAEGNLLCRAARTFGNGIPRVLVSWPLPLPILCLCQICGFGQIMLWLHAWLHRKGA